MKLERIEILMSRNKKRKRKKQRATQTNGVELLSVRKFGRKVQVITHKKKYNRKLKHKTSDE
jgi:hypothetical protein